MEIDNNEAKKLFDEFQKIWTLEKVKNMTLKEYTSVKGDGKRDDFTYWIEFKLKFLGAFGGGDSGERFGIYRYGEIPKKDYSYDDTYAWQKKLGNSANEVFEKIRDEIVKVANFSKNNELSKIDNLNLLFFGFKWKIALLYQNPDDMQMFCIFSEQKLREIARKKLNNQNFSVYEIYLKTLEKFFKNQPYRFTEVFQLSKELWEEFNKTKDTKSKYSEGEYAMPNTPTPKNPPLNQILYGPPGTGKTYNIINKALEILGVETQGKSRAELKAKFDEFRQNGQIEFITFHQSFSYEEFVEGIKPNIENENTEMTYEVKDGIFKDISDRALSNYQAHKDSLQNLPHKESNTKELFQAFAQNLQEQLTDAENGIDFNTPSLSTKMQISKVFYFKNEEAKSIAISVPNSKSNQVLKRDIVLRDYEKFKSGEIQSYKDIKPTYESLAQWHGNAIYYFALYEKIAEFEKSYKPRNQAVSEVKLKLYILIIDEINRGNISKILGELITLIEPSKRIGAEEELRVTLPYSNETFGVPSNLYIIGTMNTADRSIALLDTALRRRFEFVEMMPQPELLEIIKVENGEINLQMLLEKMNARIEFLLDREHTIGHSFFIGVDSMEALREVFGLKIIPLLQEYFYDDYAKIDAVLNGNGMVKVFSQSDLGVNLSEDFVDSEKRVYRISDSHLWNIETFNKIYKSNDSRESSDNEQ